MTNLKEKYLWMTDTHLWPWNRYKLLSIILDQKPKSVFLTGDISNSSQTLISDLEFLGSRIGRPLYFIGGNHDYSFSSFEKTHSKIREVCKKYKNLIWMTESDILPINEETCIIGAEGWYDARIGNPYYLKYTLDWILIKDFRDLPDMKSRLVKFRELAEESANNLSEKLERAVETYKTVYCLTHEPPWSEAHRADSWINEEFYRPYNCNIILGQKLEKIMENFKKRQLIVLSGHTHSPVTIHVSRNIECRVGRGSYGGKIAEEEIIYI